MKEVSLVFAIEELAIFVSLVTNFLKFKKRSVIVLLFILFDFKLSLAFHPRSKTQVIFIIMWCLGSTHQSKSSSH